MIQIPAIITKQSMFVSRATTARKLVDGKQVGRNRPKESKSQ